MYKVFTILVSTYTTIIMPKSLYKMDASSKTIVDKMKHKMKKQFKKIEEKMEDYEKYKTNYEYFKYSPYVQELLC